MSEQTQAQHLSALFGDDGSRFEEYGVSLDVVAQSGGAKVEYAVVADYDDNGNPSWEVGNRSDWMSGDPIRYVFPDGSAVVEHGDAWDIEGATPFSWQGEKA